MRIRWTVPAADDLENIKNFLLKNYPHFAEPTVRTIYQGIRTLKRSPNRGRPGHRNGTRELALRPLPYVVVYAVKPKRRNPAHPSRGARLALNFVAQRVLYGMYLSPCVNRCGYNIGCALRYRIGCCSGREVLPTRPGGAPMRSVVTLRRLPSA